MTRTNQFGYLAKSVFLRDRFGYLSNAYCTSILHTLQYFYLHKIPFVIIPKGEKSLLLRIFKLTDKKK